MKLARFKKLIFLHLQHLPMKSRGWRPLIVKMGGVNILNPKKTFIGEEVIFDTNLSRGYCYRRGSTFNSWCKNSDSFHES